MRGTFEERFRAKIDRSGNAAKTHCKRGHEFTPENTRVWHNWRQCKTCHKVVELRYAASRRTGIKPGRYNAIKTHCPRGHEYTPENTYFSRAGQSRNCRTCKRESYAARRRGIPY